jgi:hypothetical protein
MAADSLLTARLDELISLFNRKSMDLPDGLFDRRSQFCLNGTPFEAMLGRSPDDPLVLMLARGPAGYRFAAKAVQHALPDARVERGAFDDTDVPDDQSCTVTMKLSGHLRGTGHQLQTIMHARIGIGSSGAVSRADVALHREVIDMLREARLRE